MNIVFKPGTSDYDIVGTMATMEVGDVFEFESESVVEDLMTASKYAVLITTSNSRDSKITRDSTSYLENEFAHSTAAILPDGSLYHDLEINSTKVPITVPAKEIVFVVSFDSYTNLITIERK